MTNLNERFACILDPCGLWLVWDEVFNLPAEGLGLAMVGLSEAEGQRRCRFLNQRSLRVVSSNDRHTTLEVGGEDETPRADRHGLR
jgi:hypothetical protein